MIRMLSLMVAIVGLFLAPAALAIQVSVTNVSSSGGDVNLLQDGDHRLTAHKDRLARELVNFAALA